MKCGFSGCADLSLFASEFCWEHISDKEGYKNKLLQTLKDEQGLANGCNLKKVVLNKAFLGNVNLAKANLSQADLSGSQFFDARMEGAELVGTNLSGCELTHCDLKDADLTKATMANARLWNANLTNSNLTECDLSAADLWEAKLYNAKLWHTTLTDTKSLARRSFSNGYKFIEDFRISEAGVLSAEGSYRDLKLYFLSNGMYNDASWASFKEKTMERIILRKAGDLNYFPNLLMSILCGYGEKPYRIILSSMFMISIFAAAYFLLNAIEYPASPGYIMKWTDYLYYSAITFTTVGYGDLVPKACAAFRLLAAAEAFIGVFLTGLFIFTLARKYSAR